MKSKAVSGIMLTLLLIGILTLSFNIQPVEATGTITADGSNWDESVFNVYSRATELIHDPWVIESGYDFGWWAGVGNNIGQSFHVSQECLLVSTTLRLSRGHGSSGLFDINIYEFSEGTGETSAKLTSTEVDVASLPLDLDNVPSREFIFLGSPVILNPSKIYLLSIEPKPPFTWVVFSQGTNKYDEGALFHYVENQGWRSYGGDDMEFGITARVTSASARLYFNFAPNPATPGTTVTLKGVLVDGYSTPLSYAEVRVEYSAHHGIGWRYIWTLTTNENGVFSKTFKAPEPGAYLVRVSYKGNSTYMPTSNNAYLGVLSTTYGGEAAGSIFFNLVPNPTTPGTSVTLKGILRIILLDELSKSTFPVIVNIEYSINHGATWRHIWTLTTDQYGVFSKSVKTPPVKCVRLLRVSYGGSSVTTYLVVL